MYLPYRIIRWVVTLFFKIYGRWEVIGREHVPSSGSVILVSNHISYLDPPLMGCALPRIGEFMAKADLWNNRFLAFVMPLLNVFPVNPGKADLSSLRKALKVLESGMVLGLFPEGTRSKTGQLLPGEKGIAFLVKKSGAPILPMAIIGANKMLPPGAKRLYKTKLKVAFGEPIFFTPDSSREEIVTGVMRAIAKLLTDNGVPMKAAEDLTEEEKEKLEK